MNKRLVAVILAAFLVAALPFMVARARDVATPSSAPAAAAPGAAASGDPLEGMALAGIHTARVRYEPVARVIRLTGQVALTESGHADVTAPLNGVINEPLVRVGDRIEKGAPVAVINSVYGQTSLQVLQKIEQDQAALVAAQSGLTQAQNGLSQVLSGVASARTAYSQAEDNAAQAKAELVNARNDFGRKSRLFETGVFARSDVDDVRERLTKAEAVAKDTGQVVGFSRKALAVAEGNVPPSRENVRLARQSVGLADATLARDRAIYSQSQLSGSTLPSNLTPVRVGADGRYAAGTAAASTSFYLRAPIAGTVTSVTMTAGQSVSPGTVVASVLNTRSVYVDGNAFESDLPFLRAGDSVEVTVAAYPQTVFHGRVRYVGKQVEASSRTVPVRSLIDNPRDVLRPAMFATVRAHSGLYNRVLTVPDSAVLIHGDKRTVFVQTSPGKYERRTVEIGLSVSGQTEIVKGLHAGDVVVTDGNLILEGQE